MKKRRFGRKILVMSALLIFSAFTMAVCAGQGGYWTTCTDSDGREVRVFTYTEPVDYTYGELDPAPESVEGGIHQAPVRLAVPAEQEAAAPVTASNPLAGVTVLGLVMLAVLGAALYKAV